MTRIARRAAAASSLCLLIALLAAPQALANWESDYKDGKTAYEKGDYDQAIKLLRSAIGDKPQEKDKAVRISGMFLDPNLPHYYLGLAYLGREQYAKAINEFETSESMGVIGKMDLLERNLRKSKARAEQNLAARQEVAQNQAEEPTPAPPPAAPSQQEQGEKTPPASSQGEGKAAPSTPRQVEAKEMPKPAVDEGLERAKSAAAVDIAGAQKFLGESGGKLRPEERQKVESLSKGIRDAKTAGEANQLRTELSGTVSDLRTKVAARQKAEDDAAAEKALASARDQAAPVLREAEAFGRDNAKSLQAAERTGLDRRIASVKSAGSPQGVRQAASQLKSEVSKLREQITAREAAAAGVSAKQQYTAGATAYYEGRYDAAVASLKQASQSLKDDPGPQALLGSALYRQYLLSRPPDEELKNAAAAAFRAAQSIQRGYTLDEATFPPKVIAFFRQVSGSR